MGSAAENFDAYFKNRLEHFEEPPGDKAWENIAERLGHKRRKRMVAFFIRIAAGMIMIMSLSVGYYFYTHQRPVNAPSLSSEVNKNKTTGIRDNDRSNHMPNADGYDNLSDKSNKSHFYRSEEKINEKSSENITTIQSLETQKKEALFVNNQLSDNKNTNPVIADYKLHKITPVEAHNIEICQDNLITLIHARPEPQLSETDLIALQNLEEIKSKDEEKRQKEKWMLGGQVAPLYTYRMLSSDKLSNSDIDALNESEKGVFAYAGGVYFAYIANSRLSFQTGLQYSKYGQEKVAQVNVVNINYQYVENGKVFAIGGDKVCQVTINNSTGTIIASSGQDKNEYASSIVKDNRLNTDYFNLPTAETSYNGTAENMPIYQYFNFLEIPFILKYKIIDSRINLSISGGLNTNILVGNKVKIENDNQDIYKKTVDINKINYSSIAGLGIEYSLKTNLFLNFEPRFIYYINDINEGIRFNVHPYSFGAFAGISYLF
jgi:hypothetical protein